jgi:hypothetical protein
MTIRIWGMTAASQDSASAEPRSGFLRSSSSVGYFRKTAKHLTLGWLYPEPEPATMIYRITDRLHTDRTVDVPGYEIVPTVSAWLAELGVQSPLVEDLARAARGGDWAAAYAVGEHLSVEVTLAIAA